jgi:type IV/VI secretion system ImpK/VasF family protein
MTDALSRLIYPVIQFVIDVEEDAQRGSHPSLPEVRSKLMAMIDDAEQEATRSSQLAGDFPMVKRLLVYWIDEVLVNSGWKHNQAWEENTLEWEYYQEKLRADRYYEVAREALRRKGIDPLEMCILGIALGFRGEYRPDPAGLQREVRQYYDRYLERVAPLDTPEKDDAAQPLEPLPGPAILLGVSILVAITALVTLTCFVLTHLPGRFHD